MGDIKKVYNLGYLSCEKEKLEVLWSMENSLKEVLNAKGTVLK